jgi:signal transduction histidine kinase
MLLQLSDLFEKRLEIEKQIRADLNEIAKENALFAQKVWVFRKRWLLVLHGNVQSALTAALTRLQREAVIDAVTVELVKQDLIRAESAINSNLHDSLNLEDGLRQVVRAWDGICNISIDVSERAKRALVRSADSEFCVNEIVKEAVSNAVRHGEASEAKIDIDRIADDILKVDVYNNGKSLSNSDTSGIGSEMLDEICLHWELKSERKGVRLTAELPVKL